MGCRFFYFELEVFQLLEEENLEAVFTRFLFLAWLSLHMRVMVTVPKGMKMLNCPSDIIFLGMCKCHSFTTWLHQRSLKTLLHDRPPPKRESDGPSSMSQKTRLMTKAFNPCWGSSNAEFLFPWSSSCKVLKIIWKE